MSRVLEVTWKGGCGIRESDVKGRILGAPGAHAFSHRARVWLDEDGTALGAWWNDGRLAGDESRPDEPPREGHWERFVRGSWIPAALWQLAQTEGTEVEAKKQAA